MNLQENIQKIRKMMRMLSESNGDLPQGFEKVRTISTNYDPKVEELEKFLSSKGFYLGDFGKNRDGVDGRYGKYTREAHKAYLNGMSAEEFNNSMKKTPTKTSTITPSTTKPITTQVKNTPTKSIDKTNLPKNFHQIPLGTNNFRSAQMTKEQLENLIVNYGIKNVVRLNEETGGMMSVSREKRVCESTSNCQFYYKPSQEKINELLSQGNTLVHCLRGKDRTGGAVGGFLYSKGWGNTKRIWDYTTQYNEWEGELKGKISCINPSNQNCWGDKPEGRHLTQAKIFGVKNKKHAIELMQN